MHVLCILTHSKSIQELSLADPDSKPGDGITNGDVKNSGSGMGNMDTWVKERRKVSEKKTFSLKEGI